MGKMNRMSMVAGLDIGNGYVKGAAYVNGGEKSTIDFMSAVAEQRNPNDIKTKPEEFSRVIGDIFNNMDCIIDSKLVKSGQHQLFGGRGVELGRSTKEFNVASNRSKADDELSSVLVLGCLAGKALQVYFNTYGELPVDTIQVDARIALALPITEYKAKRESYAKRFKDGSHMVSIHNFDQLVRVELNILDVQVLAEGASAQFAIISYGVPLMDALLRDLANQGEKLNGITAEDVLASKNTIGVDIGEGTVNFPVFRDGLFKPDVSHSFDRGYGTVLERARERLETMNMSFESRKALANYMLQAPSPLQRARYNRIAAVVHEECDAFSHDICQEFLKVMSRVGSFIEVVFVYGGGSAALKEFLQPELISVGKEFGGDDVAYPVLYLNSQYSRTLNREGLLTVAQQVKAKADADAKAAAKAAKK